jgi:hypothetical protein
MGTPRKKASPAVPRPPERKWGPFHAGVAVCVWLNEVETAEGIRFYRSITISPRRYRDPKNHEWKDAGSLRPADLPSLILALSAAHQYVVDTPLPGEQVEGEILEDHEEAA